MYSLHVTSGTHRRSYVNRHVKIVFTPHPTPESLWFPCWSSDVRTGPVCGDPGLVSVKTPVPVGSFRGRVFPSRSSRHGCSFVPSRPDVLWNKTSFSPQKDVYTELKTSLKRIPVVCHGDPGRTDKVVTTLNPVKVVYNSR